MTPEEMRIAIAKRRGWTFALDKENVFGVAFLDRDAFNKPIWMNREDIPDYCNDLNAMMEAFMSLNSEDKVRFVKFIIF